MQFIALLKNEFKSFIFLSQHFVIIDLVYLAELSNTLIYHIGLMKFIKKYIRPLELMVMLLVVLREDALQAR